MIEIVKKNKIIIAILLIALAFTIFWFLSKPKNEDKIGIFEIGVDESNLWKASIEYSPDYSTTVHLKKDSSVRIISNVENVYYYSTNDSIVTVGFDGTVNINGVGECTIYGATDKESDGLSNHIKVVVQ